MVNIPVPRREIMQRQKSVTGPLSVLQLLRHLRIVGAGKGQGPGKK
jgi:hypothetical protein